MTPPATIQALAERLWGPGAYQLVVEGGEAVLMLGDEILYRAHSAVATETHQQALERLLTRRVEQMSELA
jgi:hypothetical protein